MGSVHDRFPNHKDTRVFACLPPVFVLVGFETGWHEGPRLHCTRSVRHIRGYGAKARISTESSQPCSVGVLSNTQHCRHKLSHNVLFVNALVETSAAIIPEVICPKWISGSKYNPFN